MSSLRVSAVLALPLGLFATDAVVTTGQPRSSSMRRRPRAPKEARQQARLNQLQGQVKQLQKQSKQSSNGKLRQDRQPRATATTRTPVRTVARFRPARPGCRSAQGTFCSLRDERGREYGSNPGLRSAPQPGDRRVLHDELRLLERRWHRLVPVETALPSTCLDRPAAVRAGRALPWSAPGRLRRDRMTRRRSSPPPDRSARISQRAAQTEPGAS